MSDLYCDHGAYGAANRLGLDAPAWGVPQEGDGLAIAASPASSTAAVLLNGQPTAGQVLSVCGVTLTAAASGNGTTSFTIGGTLDVTANNIAALINASTTNVSTSICSGGTTSSTLKNMVYARGPSNGAPTATVQLMMRVGAAGLNSHASNLITSTFGTAPTITQWNGGQSGCFGYALTDSALYAITTNSAGYGAMIGTLSVKGVVASQSDDLWFRTGNNPAISLTAASGHITAARDTTWYLRYNWDTNTKWAGDSADGAMVITATMNSTWAVTLTLHTSFNNTNCYFRALRRGGVKFKAVGTGSAKLSLAFAYQGNLGYVEGVTFEDASTNAANKVDFLTNLAALTSVRYVNCMYERSVAQASIAPLIPIPSASYLRHDFEGCLFKWNINGTGDPGPVCTHVSPSGGPVFTHFTDCEFVAVGYSDDLTMFPSGTPAWSTSMSIYADIRVENCRGIKMPSAFMGIMVSNAALDQDVHMLYLNLGNDGFRVENCRGVVDWMPAISQPYLSATLPDGVTPWSLRVLWSALGQLSKVATFALPLMRVYNRLATGARTVGLELLVPSDLTFNDKMLLLTVSYTDSTGLRREETTSTVASSGVTWTDAGTNVSKKIMLTTQASVLTNTEIAVRLDLMSAPSSGSNANIYVNPEPSIS